MKQLFIMIAFLCLTSVVAKAQQFSYQYDNSGNRTARIVSVLKSSQKTVSLTSLDEITSESDIHIFPNPTKGKFTVEITNCSEATTGEIVVFDLIGKTIDKQQITSGTIYFDLSNYPSGMYLLRINLNGEVKSIKILKE